jgi:serine/threonine protein kinase
MADLHRLGIAHNDAHTDNILVDKQGKGRWVDMGLAQASPKAALAEILGVFKPLKGGDDIVSTGGGRGEGNWQTRRWPGTGVDKAELAKERGAKSWKEFQERFPVASRVWDNQQRVIQTLERKGLDVNEINSMIYHGIRSPLNSYNKADGFSKISDQEAQQLINMIYDGI